MSAIQNISLFVPHIYSNFTSAKVSEIFNGLHIGEVKSVDLVPKMDSNSKRYNAAYIHFTSWHNTKIAHDFQERLLDPKKEVKVMYDYPWYWIVLENNQAELDKQRANMDDVSLTEHIKALKYEVEAANAKLNLTVSERNSFEERYIKEMVKNDTLMEILKDVNNKK